MPEPPGPGDPPSPDDKQEPVPPISAERHMPDPWLELMRAAEHIAARGATGTFNAVVPAWRRRTRAEARWPVSLTVAVAVLLQLTLPNQLALHPLYLLPALEGALFVGLSIANPFRFERYSRPVRAMSVVLIMLITAANATSAALLVKAIVTGHVGKDPLPLLAEGAAVWATNVIAFALWYWEFDRGGPVLRATGDRRFPDLLFPQMVTPEIATPEWDAHFVDYLYTSFTNATAFSPTDVMPLARWAKLTFLVQSAVSLVLGALVIARAVNILH
jgi:hypothetical protein